LQTIAAQRPAKALDARRLRADLVALADEWRQVLAEEKEARPIVSKLLSGRVSFRPLEKGRWELRGEGTLAGLFTHHVISGGLASPTGLAASWMPVDGISDYLRAA
jgi:hypothetical protein